jgi:hypothetical protein
VILKDGPGPGPAFVASYDDVRYDAGAPSEERAPEPERQACRMVAQVTHCPHHG